MADKKVSDKAAADQFQSTHNLPGNCLESESYQEAKKDGDKKLFVSEHGENEHEKDTLNQSKHIAIVKRKQRSEHDEPDSKRVKTKRNQTSKSHTMETKEDKRIKRDILEIFGSDDEDCAPGPGKDQSISQTKSSVKTGEQFACQKVVMYY